MDRIQYRAEPERTPDPAACDHNGTFLLIPFISHVFFLLLASCALLVFVVACENRSEYCG